MTQPVPPESVALDTVQRLLAEERRATEHALQVQASQLRREWREDLERETRQREREVEAVRHETRHTVEELKVIVTTFIAETGVKLMEQQKTLSVALYGDASRRDEPDSVFGLLRGLTTEVSRVCQLAEQGNWLWEQEFRRRALWQRRWSKVVELLLPNWRPLLLWGSGLTLLIAAFVKVLGGSS